MDLVVVNAYAIFKEVTEAKTHKKISFKEFKANCIQGVYCQVEE